MTAVDENLIHDRLVTCLHDLGVHTGAVIYLGVDLGGIALPRWPLPRSQEAMRLHRERVCSFVYSSVRAAVGMDGTILVPAFSYAYARYGTTYDHETSRSEVGPFTEWFSTRPGVTRSFHPLNSICGEGQRAPAILDEVGRSAYGTTSPFGRLAIHGTIFVSLGVALGKWLTYAHHLEQVAGVNHAYHKVFTVSARRNGVESSGPWLAFVRYLGAGVEIAVDKLEDRLRAKGMLHESRGEAGLLQAVHVADVDHIGLSMLAVDPYAFVAEPIEVQIDAPGTYRQPTGTARVVRFVREL